MSHDDFCWRHLSLFPQFAWLLSCGMQRNGRGGSSPSVGINTSRSAAECSGLLAIASSLPPHPCSHDRRNLQANFPQRPPYISVPFGWKPGRRWPFGEGRLMRRWNDKHAGGGGSFMDSWGGRGGWRGGRLKRRSGTTRWENRGEGWAWGWTGKQSSSFAWTQAERGGKMAGQSLRLTVEFSPGLCVHVCVRACMSCERRGRGERHSRGYGVCSATWLLGSSVLPTHTHTHKHKVDLLVLFSSEGPASPSCENGSRLKVPVSGGGGRSLEVGF